MTCATCHKVRAATLSMLGGGTDSVELHVDYTHKVGGVHIKYLSGYTYRNVPKVVANAITAAKAGHILENA